mgnify:CR=1 FL=1
MSPRGALSVLDEDEFAALEPALRRHQGVTNNRFFLRNLWLDSHRRRGMELLVESTGEAFAG